jgi:ABC-2 type transport system permease protein
VGGVWVAGRWDLLALILGFSLGLLLTGLGLSSVVSIAAYYPTPPPGANPFQSPPGATGITMLVQGVTGLALLVLMLPAIVLGVLALVLESHAVLFGWLCAVVSLGLGVVYLVVGVGRGARIYDRKAPDVLMRLRANS